MLTPCDNINKVSLRLALCILRLESAVNRDTEGNNRDAALRLLQFGIGNHSAPEDYEKAPDPAKFIKYDFEDENKDDIKEEKEDK